MRKEGDGMLHLKRVECLKKDKRDSVKVNSFSFLFFLWERQFFFLTLIFFFLNTIVLENCEKFKTHVVSSHEINKKLNNFDKVKLKYKIKYEINDNVGFTFETSSKV